MKLEMVLSAIGLTLTLTLTLSQAQGATDDEMWLYIANCIASQSYSCDRVALYLLGQCELGTPIPAQKNCENIANYVVDNGLGKSKKINPIRGS